MSLQIFPLHDSIAELKTSGAAPKGLPTAGTKMRDDGGELRIARKSRKSSTAPAGLGIEDRARATDLPRVGVSQMGSQLPICPRRGFSNDAPAQHLNGFQKRSQLRICRDAFKSRVDARFVPYGETSPR
jgi:hypothetical protein